MKHITTNMGDVNIELIADAGLFRGLANQNMLFHQCICELVDNSIAQKKEDEPFKIEIIFEKCKDSDNYNLYIVDNCKGMSTELLGKAMQPGESATVDNRLNEHGVGLKHSLATLSKKTGVWKIWTKDLVKGNISSVYSPFKHKMVIEDNDSFPPITSIVPNPSTIIFAEITLKYFQSVQLSRGAKSTSISKLLEWLIEHLGVTYRGYLSQNHKTLDVEGMISVTLDDLDKRVPPVNIPMKEGVDEPIPVNLDGKNYTLIYRTGKLDERIRDEYFNNQGLKAYYKGNRETQGIDIRLGNRVIATKVLFDIWDKIPHNKYNEFVGELLIPDLPRNVLKTVNNKTDIDWDDNDWLKIFEHIKENFPLLEDPRFAEEEDLRNQLIKMLGIDDENEVLQDVHVWLNGVKIDVYQKRKDSKKLTIYELKTGAATPIDLYQLKMYWDGLVIEKDYPSKAILICESYDDKIKAMADKMNLMTAENGAFAYQFNIQTIEQANLIKPRKKK